MTGLRFRAEIGVRPPYGSRYRHLSACPSFTRLRLAVGVARPLTSLRVGVDAERADKRLRLCLYSFGPLIAPESGIKARPELLYFCPVIGQFGAACQRVG